VAGDSVFAESVAVNLAQEAPSVTLAISHRVASEQLRTATEDGSRLTILESTKIVSCKGTIGSFRVTLSASGVQFQESFGLIFLSPETVRQANHRLYGLKPSDAILPLSRILEKLGNAEGKGRDSALGMQANGSIVFLAGIARESNPVIMAEVMKAAMDLQGTTGAQCYVLSSNIKVSAPGIEELYYDSRLAGVTYFKPSDGLPCITVKNDRVDAIAFRDDTTQESTVLKPDCVIVDEDILPGHQFSDLARAFSLDTDGTGFLQSGNVYRWAIHTNRPGIYAVGPARQPQIKICQELDIGNGVARSLLFQQATGAGNALALPRIDPNRCIHCLTCYRICPYRAIDFDGGNPIITDACQGCYLCSAECPRKAITMWEFPEPHLQGTDTAEPSPAKRPEFIPRLTLFACRRSAIPAAETALLMGATVTSAIEWLAVPCAGSVGIDHILSAFAEGTDGVLLLTCHDGNCHSEKGNRRARERIEEFGRLLSGMGISPQRLIIKSLAANMGAGFSQCLSEFEASIRSLGPL